MRQKWVRSELQKCTNLIFLLAAVFSVFISFILAYFLSKTPSIWYDFAWQMSQIRPAKVNESYLLYHDSVFDIYKVDFSLLFVEDFENFILSNRSQTRPSQVHESYLSPCGHVLYIYKVDFSFLFVENSDNLIWFFVKIESNQTFKSAPILSFTSWPCTLHL